MKIVLCSHENIVVSLLLVNDSKDRILKSWIHPNMKVSMENIKVRTDTLTHKSRKILIKTVKEMVKMNGLVRVNPDAIDTVDILNTNE